MINLNIEVLTLTICRKKPLRPNSLLSPPGSRRHSKDFLVQSGVREKRAGKMMNKGKKAETASCSPRGLFGSFLGRQK